jgi:hypothetical protein
MIVVKYARVGDGGVTHSRQLWVKGGGGGPCGWVGVSGDQRTTCANMAKEASLSARQSAVNILGQVINVKSLLVMTAEELVCFHVASIMLVLLAHH